MAGQQPGSRRQPAAAAGSSGSSAPSRHRAPGSTKSKRDHLRRKRQQKQQRGAGTDSDGSGEQGGGVWAAAAGLEGGAAAGAGADCTSSAAAGEAARLPLQLRSRRSAPAASEEPLAPVPLERLPPEQAGGAPGALLPRCCAAEVGWTPEGRSLGMPQRPAWQGLVGSAQELHALEEQRFRCWLQAITDSYPPERLSFFETRLEYWRQLWRVLERCDVPLVICDARHPLLHLPAALLDHFASQPGRQVLLVLNKSDLVPAAAVAAWRAFFSRHHPHVKVVAAASNAPSGQAREAAACEAAAAIMRAVLSCSVVRDGREVAAAQLVGASVEEVLCESAERNRHSKRSAPAAAAAAVGGLGDAEGLVPGSTDDGDGDGGSSGSDALLSADESGSDEELAQQLGGLMRRGAGSSTQGAAAAAAAEGCGASSPRVKAAPAAAASAGGGSDSGGSWDLKGTKLRKKAAVRVKKAGRVAAAGAASGAASAPAGAGSRGSRGSSRQGGRVAAAAGLHHASDQRSGWAAGSGTSRGSSRPGSPRSEQAWHEQQALAQLMGDEEEDLATIAGGTLDGTAGQPGSSHAVPSGQPADALKRPLVVALLGEPNVGKSSMLNALLGAHRVAVSSHPGRTRHYQTHQMTRSLVLCDCPGLVFPRLDVALPLQVLYGSFPIARCRDPYSVVRYLAERLSPPLHQLLGLTPWPQEEGQQQQQQQHCGGGAGAAGAAGRPWSALALCEAYAAKHNWRSPHGGRLDTYRAANSLLRAALAGRSGLCLAFLPPLEDGAAAGQQQQQQAATGDGCGPSGVGLDEAGTAESAGKACMHC